MSKVLNEQLSAMVATQIGKVPSCTVPEPIVLDGKSAYDLAVEQGFVGSVAAYLASLHGADGAKGETGTGIRGERGFKGDTGASGKDAVFDELTVVNLLYPVNIVLEFASDFDPNSYWAGTTWERCAEGKVVVGLSTKTGDPAWTKEVGNTSGSFKHTLTQAELPAVDLQLEMNGSMSAGDNKGFDLGMDGSGEPIKLGSLGQGQPFDIVQPSIVYAKWVRVA